MNTHTTLAPLALLLAHGTIMATIALAQSPSASATSSPATPYSTTPLTATIVADPSSSPAPPAASTRLADTWTISITPRLWYAAPSGDLVLPGGGTAPAVELEILDADEAEAAPAGQVTIRTRHQRTPWGADGFWSDGWSLAIGGAEFSGDSLTTAPAAGFTIGTLAVAGGAAVDTDLRWTTFSALAGKWVCGSNFGDTSGDTRIDLYAVAGGRLHSQEIDVTSGGNTTSHSETFFEAVVGARLEVRLVERITITIDANASFWPGDPSCFGTEIAPAFTWHALDNVGVQVGYRMLNAETESGDGVNRYTFDGSLAGLFVGVDVRF